jgi:hypothetical protein
LLTPKIAHTRILQLAAAGAVGALLSAGGYALASKRSPASPPAPVHACADLGGAHLLHVQPRCDRGQRAITWDTTATGTQVQAWGAVGGDGIIESGAGATVQHTGTGVYQVVVTAPGCRGALNNAPVVTVEDTNPPGVLIGSSFPYAWTQWDSSLEEGFTVYTGVIVNGSFAPADVSFDFQDSCR